jgi:hypothetical protein
MNGKRIAASALLLYPTANEGKGTHARIAQRQTVPALHDRFEGRARVFRGREIDESANPDAHRCGPIRTLRDSHGRRTRNRIDSPEFVVSADPHIPQLIIEDAHGREHFLSVLLMTSIESATVAEVV